MHFVFFFRGSESHRIESCSFAFDLGGALHGLRRRQPKIGKPDSIDGGLALVTRLFVLENLSSSLVGLVSDVVGPCLPHGETRVDLERINLMSRRDCIVQFR